MKKAWKFMVLALLAAMVCSALPAMAWWNLNPNPEKLRDLGEDHVKMKWWISDYGVREDGTPFSVVRKYYTSPAIKDNTIELLMSKFGYSPDVAGGLFFTAYVFEYTKDRRQFATAYLGHYDDLGNEIHGTVYDDSSEYRKKVFASVDPNQAVGKALALIPR